RSASVPTQLSAHGEGANLAATAISGGWATKSAITRLETALCAVDNTAHPIVQQGPRPRRCQSDARVSAIVLRDPAAAATLEGRHLTAYAGNAVTESGARWVRIVGW